MSYRKNNNSIFYHIRKVFVNTFLFLFACFLISLIYLIFLSKDLPSLEELQQFNPEQVSKIMSSDGKVLSELYLHKRDVVKIDKMPKNLRNALLSMEDRKFYNHSGVRFEAILRAVIVNVITLSKKQGASTITQQLARNMYNTIGFRKTINRKLKELITAINIEQTYTKSEIMELYLNSVYFGHGRYGVQSASEYYFGKNVDELMLDECAILIGLLPAPAKYSPMSHPDRAFIRKELVLRIMYEQGYISESEYDIAINKELSPRQIPENEGIAPYFTEYIRRELEKIDEELEVDLYKDGLIINTTLDSRIQEVVNINFYREMLQNQKIFNNELIKDDIKIKNISEKNKINPDSLLKILELQIIQGILNENIDRKNSKTIDYKLFKNDIKELLDNNTQLRNITNKNRINTDSLEQIFKFQKPIPRGLRNQLLVQGAMVVIDPSSGGILSMIGGRQEKNYIDHFNRSSQAKRQPGSVFKPFIYLTALEKGNRTTTELLNQPLVLFIDDTTHWNPQNHDGSTGLLTTLRDGLKRSLNLISVRIVQELVRPNDVVKNAKLFGLTTKIQPVESIALGVSDVIPLEITSAYSAISNNGIINKSRAIASIQDRHGKTIKEFLPESHEIKDENIIYILRDMMRSVIDSGTGGSIRWKYKFKSPMAGKTGTTNSKADAWFVGFTPQLAIGVWVGMDDPAISLGEKQFGSTAALPIFAKSIKEIYNLGHYYSNAEEIELRDNQDWQMPEGIVEVNVCSETNKKATRICSPKKEIFLKSNQPNKDCDIHATKLSRFKGN